MGIVVTMITLGNPRRPDLVPVELDALADTGSVFLSVPEKLRAQLDLRVLEYREVTLADGSRQRVPYVGPVQITFKNRSGFFGAIVLGDEVLLGVIPMEDMDLVVYPLSRRIDVNPANPDIAGGLAKVACVA